MGLPMVFGPWVARVQVWCLDLATHALPHTLTMGGQILTGLQETLQVSVSLSI